MARPDHIQERVNLIGRAMVERLLTDDVIKKAYGCIADGLDATTVKVFMSEGAIVADEPRVDFTERRLTAELVTKIADHHPNKLEHEVHGEVKFTIVGLDAESV